MLTKAILTGGVLALLSGSIVYFGTEGADALDLETREKVSVEETELAGAAVAETEVDAIVMTPKQAAKEKRKAARALARAEAAEAKSKASEIEKEVESVAQLDSDVETQPVKPSEVKPKTKWLDQYLKSTKPSQGKSPDESEAPETMEASEAPKTMETTEAPGLAEAEVKFESDGDEVNQTMTVTKTMTVETSESEMGETSEPVEQKSMKKIVIKMDGEDVAVWKSDGENIDMEMIEDIMRDHKNAKKEIRVLRMDGRASKMMKSEGKPNGAVDYSLVLKEARKLQVIDMRNIAFFEIIDYAIDRKDFGQAADILQDLSDPELRDTARAKIGVGLAKMGDSTAAFAVLDEMEIDELTASIRLEIITALMATKAERSMPARGR